MRVRNWIALGMTVFGFWGTARADDRKPYAMADLRVLAQQQSWGELIDHLEDIPPSNRDAEWRGLAQQAGLGALSVAGRKGPSEGLWLSEGLLGRYPVLKESRDFMSKRAELGYAAFDKCFRGRIEWLDACGERLKPFVLADPTNADLAFRVAKLLPPPAHHYYAAPAFAVAIQKKDDPRCQDPDVRLAVVSGLGQSMSANPDVVNASVQLASNLCWNALHTAVWEAMGGDSTDYLKNTCPFMKSRQTLATLLAKRCDAVAQKPN
jgi:hypothetical protein